MNPAAIRRFQTWLSLLFSLLLLVFAGSAMLHLLMSHSEPAPPAANPEKPVIDPEMVRLSPLEIMRKYKATPVSSINLITVSGRPFYQIQRSDAPGLIYLDAADGTITPVDNVYAAELAARFLGTDDLEMNAYLKDFDEEYTRNFRTLPVQRFNSRDGKGTRVYVSTATGTILHHTDNRNEFNAAIFHNLHRLGFISSESLRATLAITFAAILVVLSLLGIALFFLSRQRVRS